MPPEVKDVQPPVTWSVDAKEWLEAHGLIARSPDLRASDYDLSLSDPFRYYLTRRLGITATGHTPRALSVGTWLHARFEYFGQPRETWFPALTARLNTRIEDIEALCASTRIPSDLRLSLIEEERGNFIMALTMYEATESLPFGKDKRSIGSYLRRPEWRLLPPEMTLIANHPNWYKARLVCRPDRLAYHERHNSLWIIDYKSTSFNTTDRLSYCPNEYATLHYSFIVNYLLESGALHEMFPELPTNLTFGGMVHIAVQKPLIRFCGQDRDFTVETRALKSGPRKGTIVADRKYYGDPRPENYLGRVKQWYAGEGDYVDLKGEREKNPPVNMSFTFPSYLFDPNTQARYIERTDHLYSMATRDPVPLAFPQTGNLMSPYGRLSPYTPLYVHHPKEWPAIIAGGGFTVAHREDEVEEEPPTEKE